LSLTPKSGKLAICGWTLTKKVIPQFLVGVKGDFVAFFPMAVVFGDKKARRNNMTRDDSGHFAQKHSADRETDPRVIGALKQRASAGGVPCAVAFKIASELDVAPGLVGKTADLLELRLKKCQMGLFGYEPDKRIVKPAETVSEELETFIRNGLTDNRLSCEKAWGIAKKLGLTKMAVSSACERLGIKINACQLGAF